MKIYIVSGLIICLLFFAAGARGLAVSALFQSSSWGPSGHSQYHK